MPVSIKNLVSQSPVRWADGTLFLGKKSTEFLVLNIRTGQVEIHISDLEKDFSISRFQNLIDGVSTDENHLFIGRTEYQLTAFRPDAQPKKICWSEISGIRDPKVIWKRGEDGGINEFDSNIFNLKQEVQINGDIAIHSSFDGTFYARDRKTGTLLWAKKFNYPVVSVLKPLRPSEVHELAVYSPFSSLSSSSLVNIPIEDIGNEEFPDEQGKISHPLDALEMFSMPKKSRNTEILDLVNIGEYEGVLYVLSHIRFPRFRDPVKFTTGKLPPKDRGMALIKRPNFYSSWQQSCFPSDPNWPYCLMSSPQFAYEQQPIHLLNSGVESGDQFSLKAVKTTLLGFAIAIMSFFGVRRLWKKIRRKSIPKPRPNVLNSEFSRSSTRSKPPGFEEITLTSADYFYQVQGYNAESADALPTSFIVTDQVLGYGSHGTVVFKGQFDGRDVAVKRMLIDFFDVAGHEVNLLQQSDNHPNVIRYYCREQTERFMYIVLELCPASLFDLIERPEMPEVQSLFNEANPLDIQRLLKELMSGLEHLHSIKLVHRDLKPANLLIATNRRVLLSDFGLSKKLADDQSSFHATVQSGTIGWRAPECILNDEVSKLKDVPEGVPRGIKITKAIDIFAAGCVFYYVLTGGKHPFGNRMQRELNIAQNNTDLSDLDSDPLASDLVRRMIERDPSKRPTASQVLNHPFFWEPSKRLSFLLDVSDHLERENRHVHPVNKTLETKRSKIYNGLPSWSQIVDPIFWEDLSKFRKYFGNSVQDLLRAMRNKRHHFQELDPELKQLLGESAEAYLGYFERKFPQLLIEVYLVVEVSPEYQSVHPFKDVYYAS